MTSIKVTRKQLLIRHLALIIVSCLAVLALRVASAQGLPPELQKIFAASKIPESALSLDIREAAGPALVSINSKVARNPASVMKLVTTWTALSALGPDYVWRTSFLANKDAIVDQQGNLSGPLYIKAAGDPWFTLENLWNSLRELRMRGVKNLSQVLVDRSLFGQVAIDPGDFDNSPDRPYNASPDAMMVNFGATRVLFHPDKKARQWIPIIDPPNSRIRVQGQIEWQNGKCHGSPLVVAEVKPAAGNAVLNVSGKAAGDCGEFSLYRLASNQTQHFETLFRLLWQELGGTLSQGISAGSVPASTQLLAYNDSPTMGATITQINKYSNNVMARMLLLTLGAELNGPGATAHSGAQSVQQVLASQGINTGGWVLDNGSGLSRTGRVTASGLADMLSVAWNSALMPEYVASLAIAGVDGTVKRRMRDDLTRGQAHLKTGTLRDSRALAGYVKGASGKYYILVSMVNDANALAIKKFDDELVRWLSTQ